MEMIDDSSYITSHRVWRSDIFQSHIGMQTERLLCDPSNWCDLLKSAFSNYNNILSNLPSCNKIFLVFSQRERLGDFNKHNFQGARPQCLPSDYWGEDIFNQDVRLVRPLSLVRVVQMTIFLTQTSWLCLAQQNIHQYLWEIVCDCEVMLAKERRERGMLTCVR